MRPIPPKVARNRSRSSLREQSTIRPSATRMRRRVTCPPKQPAQWWLPPWTSAATIPPTVTNCVPGVTGTNQPRGSSSR